MLGLKRLMQAHLSIPTFLYCFNHLLANSKFSQKMKNLWLLRSVSSNSSYLSFDSLGGSSYFGIVWILWQAWPQQDFHTQNLLQILKKKLFNYLKKQQRKALLRPDSQSADSIPDRQRQTELCKYCESSASFHSTETLAPKILSANTPSPKRGPDVCP